MALIEIKGLYKCFGRSEILNNINLDVEKGKVLALIGPTGSGKTTLLRHIDMLDQPTRGSIFFHDEDICRLSSREKLLVRRRMAMVFQKPVMFSRSVYENVAYGLKVRGKGNSRDDVLHTIEDVGLSGYESRSATTLSGGEMQRIALARAMVIKPEVLLLDEPTANLDPKSASAIDDLIGRLAHSGMTVIIASHNMPECQRLANRFAVLVKGRIARTGRSNDIQTDHGQFVGFLDSIDPSEKG